MRRIAPTCIRGHEAIHLVHDLVRLRLLLDRLRRHQRRWRGRSDGQRRRLRGPREECRHRRDHVWQSPAGRCSGLEQWCRKGVTRVHACGGDPAGGLACFATPDASDWTCALGQPYPSCGGESASALGAYCLIPWLVVALLLLVGALGSILVVRLREADASSCALAGAPVTVEWSGSRSSRTSTRSSPACPRPSVATRSRC